MCTILYVVPEKGVLTNLSSYPYLGFTGASLSVGGRRLASTLIGSVMGIGFGFRRCHRAVASSPPTLAYHGAAPTVSETGTFSTIAPLNRYTKTSFLPAVGLPLFLNSSFNPTTFKIATISTVNIVGATGAGATGDAAAGEGLFPITTSEKSSSSSSRAT